jgi:hypothetical protein
MALLCVVLCALLLSGCNSMLPGLWTPEASAPMAQGMPQPGVNATGLIVSPPLADLDCAPRAGTIMCP